MEVLFSYADKNMFFHHTRNANPHPQEHKMHTHTYYEMYYFISGQGHYYIEGTSYPLVPGSILVMRMGEAHRLHILPDHSYERMVFQFKTDVFDEIDPDGNLLTAFDERALGQRNLYLPNEMNINIIRTCFNEISVQGRVTNEKELSRLLILSNTLPILFDLRRYFDLQIEKKKPSTPDVVAQVLTYINENLTQDFTLDTLSETFFISKSHLNAKFKGAIGSTIWEYTSIKRLMLAKLLISQGVPATTASIKCGWKDYSTFYRRYKTYFGVSPSQDR